MDMKTLTEQIVEQIVSGILKKLDKKDVTINVYGIHIVKLAGTTKYDIYVNFTFSYNIDDARVTKQGIYYPLHDKIVVNKMAVDYDEYI